MKTTYPMLIVALLFIYGCAPAVRQVRADDGATVYRINCSWDEFGKGADQSWSRCHNSAAQICGDKGYEVLSAKLENPSQNIVNRWVTGWFGGWPTYHYEWIMMARCKT